jgi:Na+/melibiose symporter-like transporter
MEMVNSNHFRRIDYIKITVFGFALTALWGSLHTITLPLRLLDFVAESQKNTYLGLLTFTGLVVGMMVQPIVGAISDRSGFGWGRRRPYILLGTILVLIFLPGIGAFGSYTAIFAIYCLLQVGSNTAQGSYQAFIPDLVPETKRGLASGVKSLLEILGGVALIYPIALFMDRYSTDKEGLWLWLALGAPAFVLLVAMIATMLVVREQPRRSSQLSLLSTLKESFKIDVKANRGFIWFLFSRLLIFTAFTAVQTFALYFLRDVVGVASPAAATARFSTIAVAGMLAAVYPAGYISDRVGRRPIIVCSGLLGAVGIALIAFFQQSYLVVMLCGGLLGISFGAFMSTNWALATDLVPKGEGARYLGLTNMATAGGSALARLIGPVIDSFNNYRPGLWLGYSVMFLICFICLVTGSLLLMKIKAPGLTKEA